MSEDGHGDPFADELARLKRRGSGILVVSEGDGPTVCRDLLGSDEEGRRRVLVRAAEFEELPVPGDDAIVVEATARDSRSTSAYDPGSIGAYVAGGCDVGTISTAVRNEIERVAADGLDPGELRVCLGSLDPALERHDVDTVAAALDEVFETVRAADGMAHVHLPADVEAPVVERLRPTVDVTLQTRSTPGGIHQQRWRLHAAGIDTGWLQMESR